MSNFYGLALQHFTEPTIPIEFRVAALKEAIYQLYQEYYRLGPDDIFNYDAIVRAWNKFYLQAYHTEYRRTLSTMRLLQGNEDPNCDCRLCILTMPQFYTQPGTSAEEQLFTSTETSNSAPSVSHLITLLSENPISLSPQELSEIIPRTIHSTQSPPPLVPLDSNQSPPLLIPLASLEKNTNASDEQTVEHIDGQPSDLTTNVPS